MSGHTLLEVIVQPTKRKPSPPPNSTQPRTIYTKPPTANSRAT